MVCPFQSIPVCSSRATSRHLTPPANRVRAASTRSGTRSAGYTTLQWPWCTLLWRECSGDTQVWLLQQYHICLSAAKRQAGHRIPRLSCAVPSPVTPNQRPRVWLSLPCCCLCRFLNVAVTTVNRTCNILVLQILRHTIPQYCANTRPRVCAMNARVFNTCVLKKMRLVTLASLATLELSGRSLVRGARAHSYSQPAVASCLMLRIHGVVVYASFETPTR